MPPPSTPFSRRSFLKTGALAAVPFLFRWDLRGAPVEARATLKFGLLADIHCDLMHDAESRLRAFVDEMKRTKPDFVLQLGDFCRPYEKNKKFVAMFDEFPGPRYHTLGNHDRDGGFKWDVAMKFWGMAKRYYSFDRDGWHFVVLDGNEIDPKVKPKGYPRHIGEEQLTWLTADLKATKRPTVIFSHQGLESENDGGVDNGPDVRAVLEKANTDAGWKKVGLCFCGHHHIDVKREIAGISYVQINSASYFYMGVRAKNVRYSPAIDKAYSIYGTSAPYKDPLYTTVTLGASGEISIAGKSSEFVGGTPGENGFKYKSGTNADKEVVTSKITARTFNVAVK